MKKIIFLMGLMAAVAVPAFAGDNDNIINALKQGNAAQFTAYLDNFIDLKLPGKDEIKNIGKTQASITVKGFFDDNNINGFDLSSQREMGGTSYLTGKLQGDGKTYNITVLMKAKGDKLSIITVRIN
jgi:uncharacterized protein (DUF2147 family)